MGKPPEVIALVKMLQENPAGMLGGWAVLGVLKNGTDSVYVINCRDDETQRAVENMVLTLAADIVKGRQGQ